MAHAPRNVRTKTPRPLQLRHTAVSQRLRRAYRFGSAVTPTPPPVAVSIEPDAGPQAAEFEHPLSDTPLRPAMSAWMWFALSALVCAASAASFRHFEGSAWLSRYLHPLKVNDQGPSTAALMKPPVASASVSAAPASGWHVRHDGHVPIEGGVLVVPKSFKTEAGAYDLIVHFHGDVDIVRESVGFAEIDAAVAVINLGESSQPYRQAFTEPGAFEKLLKQIDQGLAKRGVREPKLRRLALTSWSAGYGSIESILEHRRAPHADHDPLDALIALDGIHCGYVDGDRKRLNERTVLPFLRAAESAANGGLLFTMTHSRITPAGYASTSRTAALLLERVGSEPSKGPTLQIPPWVALPSAARALKKRGRLLPNHDTRVGNLHIQGFDGNGRDDHAMHLTQMAAIGLPDLAKRWSSVTPAVQEQDASSSDAEASDELADTEPVSRTPVASKPSAGVPRAARLGQHRTAAPRPRSALSSKQPSAARTGQTKDQAAPKAAPESDVYP